MAKDLLYWTKTVPYTVSVRRDILDNTGMIINNSIQWIAIEADELLNFKLANKQMILDGVLIQIETPTVDWQVPNAISNDEMDELLKNLLKLRSKLKTVDSVPTLQRLLERAKEQEKSDKIKSEIKTRIKEVTGDDEILTRSDMGGVFN